MPMKAPSAKPPKESAPTMKPRRKRGVARELLAVAQTGERQGTRPGDRGRPLAGAVAAGDRQVEGERERAEQARAHAHGNLDGVRGGVARGAGHPPREGGRGRERAVVGGRELPRREAALRTGIDIGVHLRVVAARPGRRKARGEVPSGRPRVPGADDRAYREGHSGQRDHGPRPAHANRLAFSGGAVEHAR